jgi:hypothetical protein
MVATAKLAVSWSCPTVTHLALRSTAEMPDWIA